MLGLSASTAAGDFSDIPVTWTDTPVQIDGEMSEWADLSTRFLYEPAAVMGMASDSTHLYLMIRFQDARWVNLIKRGGLKLWLDPKGKKKEIFMLKYSGGPTPEQMQQLGTNSGGTRGRPASDDSDRSRPEDNRPVFTCAIKDRIEQKSIPASGTEGPQASFGIDQGFFVYEFSIPLDEGGVRYYGLGAAPGDRISIGVFWGDLSEMRSQGGRRGGGPPGGGGHGGGRGGMGGRGGGGGHGGGDARGGDRPERPKPVEFWVKTKLAGQAKSATD
jgi:hypothetical protein